MERRSRRRPSIVAGQDLGGVFRQVLLDQLEFLQRGAQVLDDLASEDVRFREVGGVFQALVAQPEDVEAGLVPCHQLVVGDPPEPLGLLPLAELPWLVALDEVVEVGSAEGGWS